MSKAANRATSQVAGDSGSDASDTVAIASDRPRVLAKGNSQSGQGTLPPVGKTLRLLVGSQTVQAGREQIDRANAQGLRAVFARLTGLEPELIDVRTYSNEKQPSRATRESLGERFRLERQKAIADWVILARITSKAGKYKSIADSLPQFLEGVCTLAVLFGKYPSWKVQRIYYAVGRKEMAQAVREYFRVPLSAMTELPAPLRPAVVLPITSDVKAPEDLFIDDTDFRRMLIDWQRRKNLILQGPPGVGKSFIARRLAYALIGAEDESRVKMVQFHQSTSYEDFVRGWRPASQGGFDLADGVFYRFCDGARPNDGRKWVFIIDEINRGNLSKILGELLLLLEADKRSRFYAVELTYHRKDEPLFFVPENVFVLGMMNTADRSLAMVDFALRRRFAFHDLRPRFDSDRFKALLRSMNVDPQIVETLIRRVTNLNRIIAADTKNLGPGFAIGHSFFIPRAPLPNGSSQAWYESVVDAELAPLLREYWFDDGSTAERYITNLKRPQAVTTDLDGGGKPTASIPVAGRVPDKAARSTK